MDELSGKQKAAAVLLSVDSETAAEVLKNLPESDLAVVTKEMHNLDGMGPQIANVVLHEFSLRAGEDEGITATPATVRERLELAVGSDGARDLLQEIGADDSAERVFRPLRKLSPDELHKLLVDEHPQTSSIVLSHLESKQVANVIALFPEDVQVDVISRMVTTKQTDGRVLKKVGEIIRNQTTSLGERRKTPDDPRFKKTAEVINLLGQDAETRILQQLSDNAPEMAQKIREMMFVFEDLKTLSDADMRKVLMAIDTQVLALALKTASDGLKEKIFSNLSKRATETVNEELELLGLKPLSQVKAAQQQIIDSVRSLEESGELNLRGAKYEEDPLV